MGGARASFLCAALLAFPAPARAGDSVPGSAIPPVARSSHGTTADAAVPDPIATDETSPARGRPASVPVPATPVAAPFDEAGPAWGGYIGALERFVRLTIARASEDHRRASIAKPPAARPGRAGPGGIAPGAIGPEAEARDGAEVLPARLAFGPVSPNPSGGQVTFRVDLPAAAAVRIAILDVAGRVVDEIHGARPAGRHAFTWDAGYGAKRSGVYFARLEVDGGLVGTRRLVVLR